MSTSTGAIIGSIFHGRVGGPADQLSGHITFFPPYISRTSGKKVPMKAEFNAYVNSLSGTNAKTGEPGRVDRVKISIIGKRALSVCRYFGVGKMFSGSFTLNTYTGTLYRPDGQPYIMADGTKLQVQKTSLVMDEFLYGDDAPNAIALEIQHRLRPANWNVAGHPDQQAWDQMRNARKTMLWDGQSQYFGFARVFPVDGQILPLVDDAPTYAAQAPRYAAPANTMTGFANAHAHAPAPVNNGFVAMNATAPAANGFAPMAPQAPVYNAPANNGFVPAGTFVPPAGNRGF